MTDKQKEEFVSNIKQWVLLDNKQKEVFAELKTIRETKAGLNERINQYVDTNQMQKTRIEISDGELTFQTKREYQSITLGYIETCMKELFPEPEMVEKIMKHLRDKRTITMKQEIIRK